VAIYMSVYANNKTLKLTWFEGSSVYSCIDSNITTWPKKLSSISTALQNCSLLPSLHSVLSRTMHSRVMRDLKLLSALSPVVRIFCNVNPYPWTPRALLNNLHCIIDHRTWILFSSDVKVLLYRL
jgi:hypothetical protein